ncbi:MAG: actin-binding WH2 domain-containing protein [Chloroflexota bacterium]
MHNLSITEFILRNRQEYFNQIRDNFKIEDKIQALSFSSVVFLGIYGIVLGAGDSALQAIVSMIKLPILFLVTLLICAPSLHIFYILLGARQTIMQTTALLLTTVGTTSLLLLGFAPITFFFLITGDNYYFYKILNVSILGISGFLGAYFLHQGIKIVINPHAEENPKRRNLFLIIWVLLYGFVGAQMAWTLDPFIGNPEIPFVLFSNEGGNFFVDIIKSLGEIF